MGADGCHRCAGLGEDKRHPAGAPSNRVSQTQHTRAVNHIDTLPAVSSAPSDCLKSEECRQVQEQIQNVRSERDALIDTERILRNEVMPYLAERLPELDCAILLETVYKNRAKIGQTLRALIRRHTELLSRQTDK